MKPRSCILIGAPVDSGKRRTGCLMGPDAYRTAGLADVLGDLNHPVKDMGNLSPVSHSQDDPADTGALHALNQTIGWTQRLTRVAQDAMAQGIPIFMGGSQPFTWIGCRGGQLRSHARPAIVCAVAGCP